MSTGPGRFLLGADGPEVRVPGDAARYLVLLLADGRRRARSEGWRLPEDLWAVVRSLEEAGRAHAAARVAVASVPGPAGTTAADARPSSARDHHHLTTAQAAGRLGCSERHVRRLVAEGRLVATRAGRALLVDAASLAQLVDRREAP